MAQDEVSRRSRRWAVGVAGWLLLVPVALATVRLALPSDHLPLIPPDGVHGGVFLGPAHPVAGIDAGDRLLAVNGHPVAELVGSPRRREVRPGQVLHYTVENEGASRTVAVTVRPQPAWSAFLPGPRDTGNVLVGLSLLGLGGWLVRRRPADRAAHALLMLGAASLVSNAWPAPLYEPLDVWGRPWLVGVAIAALGGYMVVGVSVLLFACSFPTPIFGWRHRAWNAVAALPLAGMAGAGLLFAAGMGSLALYGGLGQIAERTWELTVAAGLLVLAGRWLRSWHDPLARRRLGLVGLGFGLSFGIGLVGKFSPALPMSPAMYFVIVACFPLAVATAVVKDDLFELNVALNRSVVALVSAAVLLAGYLAAVAGTAAISGAHGPVVALPAAGLVAVAAAPLRTAVQRLIGRRLFGTGSDPRLVFHRLATRLAVADDPESLMAAVVQTATESLRLSFAAVELRAGEHWQTVEQRGRRPSQIESFDLVSGDGVVGHLLVAPRRDVHILSPVDRQLLQDLADQSGVAARVAGLVTDLRSAQQRLLVARESERDRVHRDLHDSVGPSLVGLTLQLEVAAEMAQGSQLGALVARLHGDAARATEDIRRLVRDLRPADLEELGLPAAVASAAARLRSPNGPTFDLDTPARLPELSAQVEDAAYKICLEAMSNAVRHSGASSCAVRLRRSDEDALELEIADDGNGMRLPASTGTGLRSMRERAEAVGGWLQVDSQPQGGTRILAGLPLRTLP